MSTKSVNKHKNKKSCSTKSSVPMVPGMTRAQVAEWIKELNKSMGKGYTEDDYDDEVRHCDGRGELSSDDPSSFEYNDYVKSEEQDIPMSNVSFWPANSATNTVVMVGANEITGVVKATLDYDANMELPVLKLEILGPSIR